MKMLEGDTGKRVKWEDELDSSWLGKYWPRGYKTFFMLNSTEHKISTAH